MRASMMALALVASACGASSHSIGDDDAAFDGGTPDDEALETTLDPPGDFVEMPLSIAFEANLDASFECRVDAGAWAECSSPFVLESLPLGPHGFEVRARTDERVDESPAAADFVVVQIATHPNIAYLEAGGAFIPSGGDFYEIDYFNWPQGFVPFYDLYADDFMCLVVWTSFTVPGLWAFADPLRTDIEGVGFENVPGGWGNGDRSAAAGSAGTLEHIAFMNSRTAADAFGGSIGDQYIVNVLAQEFGHRWGAYLRIPRVDERDILRDDLAVHWEWMVGLDEASPMRDSALLPPVEVRSGGFGIDRIDFPVDASVFASIDLYVMGLLPPEEVPDFFYVRSPVPSEIPPDAFWTGFSFEGERVDVTIDDIIEANGERVPAVQDAPKSFRMAFLIVVPDGERPDVGLLNWVDRVRRDWERFFPESTRELGSVDTALQDATRGF